MLKEFRAFILRGTVVDLAVGVVIGAAFTGFVNSVVSAFIRLWFRNINDIESLKYCFGTMTDKGCDGRVFAWGLIVSTILTFVVTATIVFFFVVKPVNTLMAKFKAEEPTQQTTRECPECLSKIPHAARRCAYCTAQIGPAASTV